MKKAGSRISLAALSSCLFLEVMFHFSNRSSKEITEACHISARSTMATGFFSSNWRHFLHPESVTSISGIHADCFVSSVAEWDNYQFSTELWVFCSIGKTPQIYTLIVPLCKTPPVENTAFTTVQQQAGSRGWEDLQLLDKCNRISSLKSW